MKNKLYLLFVLISFISAISFSQAPGNICLGTDVNACIGTTVSIEDCNPGSGSANVLALTNASVIHPLTDDQYSAVVNIGFSFSFYGNTYTQCVVGSNGIISFDLTNAGGFCPWGLTTAGTFPNTTFATTFNSLMPAYQDMNPSSTASPAAEIRTETFGVAPNRRFVVLFKDVIAFSAPNNECNYLGVIINEGSNTFEYHIGNKPIVVGWNNGLAVQGSENIDGTVAHITPGRNNSVWSVTTPEAKIWTPTSPTNTTSYTISPIPYKTITSPTSTFAWGNTLNNTTEPYNNGVLVVDPVLPGVTGYFVTVAATGCGPIGGSSDTTYITGISSSVSATAIDDLCSASIGSVTATPTSGSPIYTYDWPSLGQSTQTVNGVPAGTYIVNMIDGNGCASTASVTVGDTPANYSSSSTLVSCANGNDGTAFVEMIPQLGNITYLWNDPAAQTTQTAVGLTAGTYDCTITSDIGCVSTLSVTVTEIPGITASITSQSDVTCNSGNDGIITINVIDGTLPYSYSWDRSSSATQTATDLMVGNHTITITDGNNCVTSITGTLGEPLPLSISSLTPDTQICPEDALLLNVAGSGGSSAYTFTWSQNGTIIDTGDEIEVDPDVTNTTYCVELSEVCGSPVTSECMTITFPTPIVPSSIPDMPTKCVPDTFYFTNTSTNPTEIATTFWEFGDNITHTGLTSGNNPISHYYNTTGFMDITMTVTSVFGCVYTDTMKGIIEVIPTPTASWVFSNNPATIFETVIHMQSNSSSDVVSWQWDSPGSYPSSSSLENPTFEFPEDVVEQYPITLVVTNERGCTDTTTLYAQIVEAINFFAPTAFTPDDNEYNQYWKPVILGIDIYDYEMYVYNRWGEVVWESHDPSVGWDGTYHGRVIANDTYIWKATVKNPYKDERINFNGHVSILKRKSSFVPE